MPVQHEPDRERPLRAKHEESLSDRQSDAISDARRKTSKFSAPEPREKLNTIMDGHSLYLRIIEQFKQRWEDVEAGSEYVERTRRAHARP